MTLQENFINKGFSVVEAEKNENRLLEFLKENYPQTIRGNEVKWDELKNTLGLPVDEKVNGYGLNFVGRNVANAKYKQKTTKELKINKVFSKDFDNAQNLILKGDNLDSLKILKSHYNGQIKCIYIDPPYNTAKDDFIYPDKFNKEETEVLGLANISETDFDRMQFSFSTKKSHNGWLSFMYPRLMLAHDLLAKDGVIFISIDDNEQANLKLLCDEIFGEDNFLGQIIWQTATDNNPTQIATEHEYVIVYAKSILIQDFWEIQSDKGLIIQEKYDELRSLHGNDNELIQKSLRKWIKQQANGDDLSGVSHYSYVDEQGVFYPGNSANTKPGGYTYDIIHPQTGQICAKPEYGYRWPLATFTAADAKGDVMWGETENTIPKIKKRLDTVTQKLKSYYYEDNRGTTADLKNLFDGYKVFDNPKSVNFIKHILKFATKATSNDVILDFFAGSGTTGHAVMQLNAEDGGNRKFVLCQINEDIDPKKKKEAFQFCEKNNLPPVISSITCERIKRAGDKIQREIDNKQEISNTGFKVFDAVDAPKLEIEDGQIILQNIENDPLSRIYNMIFSVGIDNPTVMPECVLENCLYKIGNNHYITNATELDKSENKHFLANAIKSGKVYVDGWTASINTTLQNIKDDVKIVF